MRTVDDEKDVTVLISKKVELTQEQRRTLLIKAKIFDTKGDYLSDFFSPETIRKNKEHRFLARSK